MSLITQILTAGLPLANAFLLWKILQAVKVMADAEKNKKELSETVRKFGQMFAEAAEVPKPPKKLKVEEI
jgi:hypothetical protein